MTMIDRTPPLPSWAPEDARRERLETLSRPLETPDEIRVDDRVLESTPEPESLKDEDLLVKISKVEYGRLSPQAQRVLDVYVESLALFLEKNRGYGTTSEHLGARGQYADMHRKMGKLKHTLWDGNEVVGESIEEMCMDLMGHAALTIDFLREEQK